jgi:hypothetical protein
MLVREEECAETAKIKLKKEFLKAQPIIRLY